MFGLGTFFGINWMVAVGGAYMAFLWFPFTPEKIVTVFIAIWLLRLIFPNDKKTLAVLYEMRDRIKEKMRARKEARKSRKNKQ